MELTNRLAAEYGLQLVYKKAFNEILSEEQSSRDFGPLLAKMGVLNAEGASNMDEAQWEAASELIVFVHVNLK
jgi:mRNA (guanine-N7-)-methyltransferase